VSISQPPVSAILIMRRLGHRGRGRYRNRGRISVGFIDTDTDPDTDADGPLSQSRIAAPSLLTCKASSRHHFQQGSENL
jgi:hypothetical protein